MTASPRVHASSAALHDAKRGTSINDELHERHAISVAPTANARENKLDFSNAYYGDDKCTEIVEHARAAPFPTMLDLRGNRFEAAGAKVLAELLRSQHNIVSLSLEWNNVGVLDQGIEALAAALKVDTQLLVLDLRNNNVGPEGAKALAKALARNRSLRQLDLRWNDIGNAGVLAFREALQSNHTLVTLGLMGNNSNLKHAEEIEKLLTRNRAFQEQPAQSPPKRAASPPPIVDTTHTEAITRPADDQLLLQVLAEKENLEADVALAHKETRKLAEQVEEREMHLQMLRKDVENLKDERSRLQQRESDAKRESHELTMQLDALENRRKLEFDEYRTARTALERDASVLRDKLSHAEALQSKSLEQKSKQIAELEDQKYAQDSELHKLTLSNRALEDDVAKLRKQLLDAHKDAEKRESLLVASHQSALAAQQRQHELEVSALTSQLEHATRQCDEHVRTTAALKERAESLQASVLHAKLSHERELSELKKQWDVELAARIERAVGSIEAQVEDVKRGRQHLERDVETHLATILRLRQEHIALQQSSDERQRALHDELAQQARELQTKHELWTQVTNDKARCDEKLEAYARRLAEQDARLVRLQETYDERIREMAASTKRHAQELSGALKRKAETIAALERQQLQLERALSQQRHEHETRLDSFADSVARFLQEQVASERARRQDTHAHTPVASGGEGKGDGDDVELHESERDGDEDGT